MIPEFKLNNIRHTAHTNQIHSCISSKISLFVKRRFLTMTFSTLCDARKCKQPY